MSTPKSQTVLFFHSAQARDSPADEKLRGIYRFARARDWRVIALPAPGGPADVRREIARWNPVGCLVDMNESCKAFTRSATGTLPVAFLDFDDRLMGGRTFRVNHDPVAVSALAARHLAGLGLEHFAFVGYSIAWRWSAARFEAFRQKLGERAKSLSDFTFPAGKVPDGRMRQRFMRWLDKLPTPCGVMLADDGLAEELYPACERLHLSIPDDVAVIGVDDDEKFCANLTPPLTSIRLDFNQAGWLLAELLNSQIEGSALWPHTRTYEPLGIAPRKSTALVAHAQHFLARKLRDAIVENADHANVEQIVSAFPQSRRLLEMRFRAAFGMSILDAIQIERLNCAQTLLKNTDLSVDKVATASGYGSAVPLQRLFKEKTGMTMSAWRKATVGNR